MKNFDGIMHFSPNEFEHPEKMNPVLLKALDEARTIAGVPFVITSSYRADSDTSHGRGNGVDIRCHTSGQRYWIVSALLQAGFNRIGIYDKHIHADCDDIHRAPQNVIWWGTSV